MRPRSLEEFIGQEHFLGPGKLLRRLLQADRLNSVIFHGPPGCGKTSLAHVIARQTRCHFRQLNAVSAGIKEMREFLQEAAHELEETGQRTILFVDELHHFNRDAAGHPPAGCGGRPHHPAGHDDAESVLRRQLAALEPQSDFQLRAADARTYPHGGAACPGRFGARSGRVPVDMREEALAFLAEISDGDARRR